MSLNKSDIEDLVDVIHQDTGIQGTTTYEDMKTRFFESSWSALCHQTNRAARGYLPGDTSPEARIYFLMCKAFSSAN